MLFAVMLGTRAIERGLLCRGMRVLRAIGNNAAQRLLGSERIQTRA